ncbi:Trihelix transcription factor ASR3 [Quillaja saponaria]|uniref:Trihelix transcription factor ASR3 n=1 Tax=Quillaja saponaria TaxID=32244 RepID=A0AAD7LXA3_QUISA|nr:Trihelix transcription factor ASR3 [Quillaja saponaria]
MKREDSNQSGSGSRRTRSQVAPDWSLMDSLILVNEIAAVEADCKKVLSSYQKWKIIAENCTALDVVRSLNQCRRKWDSLLVEYNKIKQWESKLRNGSYWLLESERVKKLGLPENFDKDLFKAIDDLVNAREDRCDTDPDSDPEAEAEAEMLDVIAEPGSKGGRRRFRSQICRSEKLKKSLLEDLSEEEAEKRCVEAKLEKSYAGGKHEESYLEKGSLTSLEEEKHQLICTEEKPQKDHLEEVPLKSLSELKLHKDHVTKSPRKKHTEKKTISAEEKELMLTAKLHENAEQIQAIVSETTDHDLKNVEDNQIEYARRRGDKLIACLGDVVNTLNQLCDLVQECK